MSLNITINRTPLRSYKRFTSCSAPIHLIRLNRKKTRRANTASPTTLAMMVIIILISPATTAEVAALLGKAEGATTPAEVMTPAAVVVAMLANLERPVVPVAVVALLANLLGRPVTLALAEATAVANPGSLTYEARATVDPGWSC